MNPWWPYDTPMHYDRQGNPMTMMQWATLSAKGGDTYKRVASTHIGPVWISTAWLGIDHRFGEGPPLIFETMIFIDDDATVHPSVRELNTECWRYSTEAEALAGHDQVVAAVRNMLADVTAADEVLDEATEGVDGP